MRRLAVAMLLLGLMLPAAPSHAAGTLAAEGDAQLLVLAARMGWPGTGTQESPIIIRGLDITAFDGDGFSLTGTTLHVVVDGARISSGGSAWDAIRLVGAGHVTVRGARLEASRTCIFAQNTRDLVLEDNVAGACQTGLALDGVGNATIRGNRLSVNDVDVSLAASAQNHFDANTLTIAAGGLGFRFADEPSWQNDIPATNTVNGQSMAWIRGGGNQTLAGLRVDLPGITNVAQIAILNVSAITLESPFAGAGQAAGILVAGGGSVTLRDATVERNAGAGILANGTSALTLDAPRAQQNARGIQLSSIANVQITDAFVARNGGDGISTALTSGRISGATLRDNGGAALSARQGSLVIDALDASGGEGIALDGTSASIANSSIRADDVAIALADVAGASITQNQLVAGTTGIVFTRSRNGTFDGNNISVPDGAIGLRFDGNASYANNITSKNLVDGHPVRWYAGLHGTKDAPLVIDDAAADGPGITNVAQLVVHASEYVTLHGARALNGSADGILLSDSAHITIDQPLVGNNARRGIAIAGGSNIVINDADARGNGEAGVSIKGRADRVALAAGRIADNAGPGIDALDATRLSVEGAQISGNHGGILATNARALSVTNNTLGANGPFGIALSAAGPGSNVSANRVIGSAKSLEIGKTAGATFQENRLEASATVTGVWFDDETSYDNSLDASNVVGGAPLQWITHANGPHLFDIRVEAPGVTNVAQAAVLDSSNVTIEGSLLANGTKAGLLLRNVTGAHIHAPRATGNAGAGIEVQQGSRVELTDVAASRNGIGVRIAGGDNVTLTRANLTGNTVGASASGIADPILTDNLFANNTGDGLRLAALARGNVRGNELRLNGLSLAGLGTLVADTTITNAAIGVKFEGATGWTLRGTNATGAEGYHLDGPASYENAVDASNTFADAPVQWFDHPRHETIHGTTSTTPGVLNVAQILVVAPFDVIIDSPLVANGDGDGLLLAAPLDTRVVHADIRNNTGSAIAIAPGAARPDNITIEDSVLSTNGGDGIALVAVDRATIRRVLAEGNDGAGIFASGARELSLLDSTLKDNKAAGIRLAGVAPGARVSGNNATGSPVGIGLAKTTFATLQRNQIEPTSDGVGLEVADAESYDNAIDATNTVRGVALQWLVGLTGTQASPIVLHDVHADAPRMTNVGQIVLYHASNVVLDGFTASNGSARGVYVYQSSNVRLTHGTLVGNHDGVHLHDTLSSQIDNLSIKGGQNGVYLTRSSQNRIRDLIAFDVDVGVAITDAGSQDNVVSEIEAGRARSASVTDASHENLVVDAGLDHAVQPEQRFLMSDSTATARYESERIANISWAFDDGQPGFGLHPAHAFASAGVHGATMTVKTLDGQTLFDSAIIRVGAAAQAAATATSTSGPNGGDPTKQIPPELANDTNASDTAAEAAPKSGGLPWLPIGIGAGLAALAGAGGVALWMRRKKA